MSRLHKTIKISLARKMEGVFLLLLLFGWYKNGLLPFIHGYHSFSQVLLVFLYPLLGMGLGKLFDVVFKNEKIYDYFFYGMLFSLFLPLSTPLWLYLLFLTGLFLFHFFVLEKKDLDLNFLVLGKLLLVLCLIFLDNYHYSNALESSQRFVYSFVDGLMGHQISGLFISNVLLIFGGYLFLSFDAYYKKEIPIYSYGLYFLSLIGYAIYKEDMTFFLEYFCNSQVVAGLVILAPLSLFSPYSKKRKSLYSLLIGVLILPFSLKFSFQEGVFLAILVANLCLLFLGIIGSPLNKNLTKNLHKKITL